MAYRERDVALPGSAQAEITMAVAFTGDGPATNSRITRDVARGSVWSLGGQVVTLGASLVATPFVVRLMGPESYGVLALINLIAGYASVADLGMGQASTKFASEARASGGDDNEVRVVWTSLLVVLVPTIAGGLLLTLLAGPIAERGFRLPGHLQAGAIVAIRLSTLGFAARSVAGVFNTPELVRLRIDLYTIITTAGAAGQVALVPLVLWGGGDLISAVAVSAVMGAGIALSHGIISLRLLPGLVHPRLDFGLIKPLLGFGLATTAMTLVGLALANGEKILIVRYASVADLAYYSVAFTVARLLALLPGALAQPLLPAFASLSAGVDFERRGQLYWRSFRGLLLATLPLAALITTAGSPLLTVLAGTEYAAHGLLPLYVLAFGCVWDGLSYVPRILLSAVGKPQTILRYQLIDLVPYFVVAFFLVGRFGAVGAAFAWAARAMFECMLLIYAARPICGSSLDNALKPVWRYVAAVTGLVGPIALAIWEQASTGILFIAGACAVLAYGVISWNWLLALEERRWISSTLNSAFQSVLARTGLGRREPGLVRPRL